MPHRVCNCNAEAEAAASLLDFVKLQLQRRVCFSFRPYQFTAASSSTAAPSSTAAVKYRFCVELKKQISCSLQLSNKVDSYVAFKGEVLVSLSKPGHHNALEVDVVSQAKYKWLDKDEDAIKKSFNSRGSLALKNALFKVRSGKDEGGWIGENNLQELRVKWQAEDWQKLSLINKQNRQAQDGHNVHSGGSISAREHAKKMKVDLNREPTLYELYERLHRPKGKPNEWLNEKQAKIAEIFQTQMTERQSQSGEGSSNNSTQQSENDIYLEVVGGINKKGRIFGLGSQAATIKALMKDSISTDGTSAEEVAILKDKVQALTTELQQKNLEQEGIKQKVDRYERMFERLMLNKNLKALLIEPEEAADNCNEEMGEDGLDGDSLFD